MITDKMLKSKKFGHIVKPSARRVALQACEAQAAMFKVMQELDHLECCLDRQLASEIGSAAPEIAQDPKILRDFTASFKKRQGNIEQLRRLQSHMLRELKDVLGFSDRRTRWAR